MDWSFPDDVRGWLTPEEGRGLGELARGKRVLEIGSYCGRSTICMARTATSVTCIDPFDGRATSEPDDTLGEFKANISRFGLTDKVTAFRGTTEDVAPTLEGKFDLVFIDGAHDYDSVRSDISAALRVLSHDGLLAFHDYREYPGEHDGRWDNWVTKAVKDCLATGAKLIARHGTVAVVRPAAVLSNGAVRQPRREDKAKPVVFLGMPSYDGKVSIGAAEAYFLTPTRGDCDVVRARACSSFLTKTFNDLWCSALNNRANGITHFAMIHADIIPITHGWLDVLMGELVRLDADMVSAVSPIKSEHGWTSTAIQVDGGEPWVRRRLTMREVYDLPETFGAEDVGGPLLLNTGLWVCDLRRPWCEKVCFDVFNRIVRNRDGLWHTESISEDWLLSAVLNSMGCKLYATRKVTLAHDGGKEYTTDHAWGTQGTDEVYEKIAKQRGASDAADQVHEGLSGEGAHLEGRQTEPGGLPVLCGRPGG